MNENTSIGSFSVDSEPNLSRVTRMLRRAQASLQGATGGAPSYKELEEWTGVAEETVRDWFNNKGRPTAEFIIQCLERLSQSTRHGILDQVCRVFPTLEGSRLKCDQTIISLVKTILRQPRGLTIIQGGN